MELEIYTWPFLVFALASSIPENPREIPPVKNYLLSKVKLTYRRKTDLGFQHDYMCKRCILPYSANIDNKPRKQALGPPNPGAN